MGSILDFLFKVSCLSGVIFSFTGTGLGRVAKRAVIRAGGDSLRGQDWLRFLFLRSYQELGDGNVRRFCVAARFCVLGSITCFAMAVLLILADISLRFLVPSALPSFR